MSGTAPKPDQSSKDSTAIVTVNIDDFTRTRDSVIIALASLQSAVSDLSKAYINHANTVLNRGPSALDIGGITSSLLENGLLNVARPPSPGPEGERKKKRKRAPPDPNAPKRALTPYFLYMHHNRQKIADELGQNARPKEVADEGTRRWAAMNAQEREVWQTLYKQNLNVYKAKMKAYKAGLAIPVEDEAVNEAAAAQQQLHEGVRQATEDRSSEESSSSEEEEATPEPPREPTPPRSSKRRRTLDAKLPAPVASPPKPSPPKKPSPEKKKRGKAAAEEKPKRAQPAVAETPKSEKKTRKKRKSEAAAAE
ncbi:hypothetical protein D8B26_000556 [Coccidioides posadasii str. Silveira]|uniref:HMG box domain containing protein n=2 Tax=Coccidioides posadasii TaxID=199306 RepID=C5P0Q5_COCP7|nr:HMG box domain containing protein [Coccidioides posadasii C735 delta SOWgp]EER29263.1 HMG box domain containing protein [Coccidioides posadasii C735 delta SOWgp]QVM05849.1 hypothetical protein D8B26_000556 [Coccidioides posadasii str. Silveira]|eukprot:XP_003071408.1 HMG box domain containing protein [Coccidioides posadasii C735 delta SOWgp]